MSTIDTLLKSVAPEPIRPDAAVVDADLARGRAALVLARRRRTHRRVGAGVASLAAAAAAAVIVGTSSAPPSSSHAPVHRGSASGPGIRLVDYTGAQLPGFVVRQLPAGWHLSTSTRTALLITPDDGSLNDDPDDFAGKLAVLASSSDEHGLGSGEDVSVDGRPGRVDDQQGVLLLRYTAPNGFGIDIQAPPALHWTAAQIVAFAEGVQVTSHAVHTLG